MNERRPLKLSIENIHHKPLTDEEARADGWVAADAVLVVRYTVANEQLLFSVSEVAVAKETGELQGFSDELLMQTWVGLTQHISERFSPKAGMAKALLQSCLGALGSAPAMLQSAVERAEATLASDAAGAAVPGTTRSES